MKMKELLMFGFILVCAAGFLSTACASQDVNICNVHFNVLDGFNQVESDVDSTHVDNDGVDTEDIDGTVVDKKVTREYTNSNGDKLELTVGVLNGNDIESLYAFGYVKKSIAGKDGYFKTEMDDGRQQYKFQYLENGKLIKINAPSEADISKVIG